MGNAYQSLTGSGNAAIAFDQTISAMPSRDLRNCAMACTLIWCTRGMEKPGFPSDFDPSDQLWMFDL